MNDWVYKGSTFIPPEDFSPKTIYGFVYLIVCIPTGKKYIGKKLFWRKNKRKLVESDWRKYFGSNKILLEELKHNPISNFSREILHLCRSKSECSYLEAKEQFVTDCILRSDYYNDWLSVRVTRKHMQRFALSDNSAIPSVPSGIS